MIDFVRNIDEYQKSKNDFEIIKRSEKDIFQFSLKLEDSIVFFKEFYTGFIIFLEKNKETDFTFYVYEPLPKEYYYKHFNCFNILNIPISTSYKDYYYILNKDPGDSLADALLFNTKKIILFSDSKSWLIKLDRNRERCVVKFSDYKTKQLFIDCIDKDIIEYGYSL